MRINTIVLTISLLSLGVVADESSIKKEGMEYIMMLGGTLKSELQAKMKEDPSGVSAAAFCAGSAENLTKEVNAKLPKYASVRRTALKTRSEANAPDATDIGVMESFQSEIASKTFNPQSPIKVVSVGETTRVYKPLVMEAACLKCHGESISAEINTMIHKQYPNDKAIGFKEGELRGVIVAEIQKH